MNNFTVKVVLIALHLFLCFNLSFSQDKVTSLLKEQKENPIWKEEFIYRRSLNARGISDEVINVLVAEKIAFIKSGRQIKWSVPAQLGGLKPGAPCSGMGVEGGWGDWQGQTGVYDEGTNPNNPSILTFAALAVPAAPRFNITTGPGIDPCTPAPGGPSIPVVAPGFGTSSIQLGVREQNGNDGQCGGTLGLGSGCAEQLIYSLSVTKQDTNFLYAFAYVVENPSIHDTKDQPFIEFKILDSKGDTLDCSYQRYFGNSTTPGLYNATCLPPGTNQGDVVYKPWTTVGVNLSKYVGQVVTVIITNVDCSQGGHFAHSYWDFSCGVLSTNPASYCVGENVTITAPSNPLIKYTYQWYLNKLKYTPGGTNQTITPKPQPGDTFYVDIKQPSGCGFKIVYVPTPLSVGANFTYATTCGSGSITFKDSAVVIPGMVVSSWRWTFQNGTPATFNGKNPPAITFPAGTHSVTLITISQNGCRDTMIKVVKVGGSPQAVFTSSPVCVGLPTQFTNTSTQQPGDLIVTSVWSFPGGIPASSNLATPLPVVYPAGNYTATLSIVTPQGCSSTVSRHVVVNPSPVVNLKGTNVCLNSKPNNFTDLTTANNTVASWDWNFGDGSSSTLANPTHTYSAVGTYTITLGVTNNFGCKDKNTTKVAVHPIPTPNFLSKPVCAGDTTFFVNQSTISNGSITGWNWNFGEPISGANNTSTIQTPWHIYAGSGPYTVSLTVTSDSGCTFIKTQPAATVPPPTALFTAPNACVNAGTTLFTNNSTAYSSLDSIVKWNWSFGDGGVSTVQTPSHTYTNSGTYTSTLVVTTVAGCKDTVTYRHTIYGLPKALYSDSAKGCAPVRATFKDLSATSDGISTIATWEWSFPGGSPTASTGVNPSVTWVNPGVYDVKLIVSTNFGCKDTTITPQYIHVYAWPKADFSVAPDIAPATDPVFSFSDLWTSNVATWRWNFGDGSAIDSLQTDPKHSYASVATNNDFYNYRICLNVKTIHGCYDSICRPIDILPEFEFYIPNSFTPNEDKNNQVFFGKSRGVKEYYIWIFDRWGNLLWACDRKGKNTDWDMPSQDGMSSACKWDGKIEREAGAADLNGNSGNLMQEDVYVWKVRLTDIFDVKHNYVGHVSIIR